MLEREAELQRERMFGMGGMGGYGGIGYDTMGCGAMGFGGRDFITERGGMFGTDIIEERRDIFGGTDIIEERRGLFGTDITEVRSERCVPTCSATLRSQISALTCSETSPLKEKSL